MGRVSMRAGRFAGAGALVIIPPNSTQAGGKGGIGTLTANQGKQNWLILFGAYRAIGKIRW